MKDIPIPVLSGDPEVRAIEIGMLDALRRANDTGKEFVLTDRRIEKLDYVSCGYAVSFTLVSKADL